MEWIISLLSTLGIFAAALLILVFFHELGHFLAAKFFGMRVERFSLGFPPRIWGFKKGDTDYCVGATPLGGYVKISGMIDESMDTDHLEEEPQPWEFRSKPVWQRIVVITAGVIFNMILAVLIYAGLALTAGETKVELDSVGGLYVAEGSLAQQIGFRSGDRILSVNGEQVPYFSDLVAPTQLTRSDVHYTVQRGGEEVTVGLPDSALNEFSRQGFISPTNAIPSRVRQVQEGSPADSAGLQAGDRIISLNGDSVAWWAQLVEGIRSSTSDSLSLQVARGDRTLAYTMRPRADGTIGIASPAPDEIFEIHRFQYGLFESMRVGGEKTAATFTGIIQGFSKLFSGDISVRENLGGPVAIANVTREATEVGGMIGFWNITAFLSITLAIMNILPIPVLDGGHLMFLFYEGITRREPSAKVRMVLQQIGFVLIIALFIYVTFNDILRQFG
ncbi:MAG: RIP metalloprotease RseP [Balneolaceae bacterium]|nr:RIP metalloprotease RseP [Balneolaceae bacterium]